jgi:hypothetical protein
MILQEILKHLPGCFLVSGESTMQVSHLMVPASQSGRRLMCHLCAAYQLIQSQINALKLFSVKPGELFPDTGVIRMHF